MNKNVLLYFKKISAFFFFITTIITFLIALFLLNEYRKAPEITKESLTDTLSSRIYDKDNNVIAILGNERREFVESSDIPQEVIDAVLSIEDSRFENHIGVDPKRIIKAVLVNLSAGQSLEGASTITQQVVKQSLLTSTKSYERKIQEAFLSLELEKKYSKEDILEMYLNKIFYSDNQYGIKTASKYFYNKELNELTIPQIALLAGIPQHPNAYNPYDNPDGAKERRNIVLLSMYNNGKLSKADYQKYIAVDITDGLVEKQGQNRLLNTITNPLFASYIDLVVKEVANSEVFQNEKDPFSLGLHIHTNLNQELQSSIQTMVDNQTLPMRPHNAQAAITVLDTKTGLVEALSGGKNYTYGGFNFAVDSKLQAGSSIKPILDYGPGIEYYGWDGATNFQDKPYIIPGTNINIQNWDRQYRGNVTLRKALALSYNVPAVNAFEQVGFERSKHFANKLGINIEANVATTAIGGSTDTVSPIQMAGAFAAFGNKGYYNKPSTIIKITDRFGEEITNFKQDTKKVMNESTAFIMTNLLKDVLTVNGTSPLGAVYGWELAAKSGSSTFDETLARSLGIDYINEVKDSWIIGYSTEHTVAVWQGPDTVDSASKALKASQSATTQQIFSHVMKLAHNNTPPAKFEIPETVKLKGTEYYATDNNTETDNMYAGTNLDAVYQRSLAENARNNRSLLPLITNRQNTQTTNRTQNNSNQTNNRQTTNTQNRNR